ncbi:nucleotide pyrophosphohydrolase [Microbacterium esteraromaticum]|uniref:nucleotide pyrophosphohydrolase n=1 Tax=Microbacterium esteraromaticum TaxID=57043 RepID=UPI001A8C9AD5|nr:nucleotide pyrophosphohydrolase [Microbacterium esteraromaticum]MBN8424662.1 nucleotide pyrophosphohydrolase [Microbacterium esteraromaticum]WDH79058.1 nucleotide pyrophosphohydrolase [Microbacterium esteraromaticum]
MDRFTQFSLQINDFARERGWDALHDSKSLALALVGEVGEVAEVLQWLTPEEQTHLRDDSSSHRQQLREELADVLIYLIELAAHVEIDLLDAAEAKLQLNARKHPLTAATSNDPRDE